jgi:kynurenine formamidase
VSRRNDTRKKVPKKTRSLRFIDLSIAIEDGLPSDPPGLIPKIDYVDHVTGAEEMTTLFFPGLGREQLPAGFGWAVEHVHLTTHAGTHLDAPYHYSPTMDHGKPALTIDKIPLEWCFHDGVILDFRWKADGEFITVRDIEREAGRIEYEIKPFDIVIIQTGADTAWGTQDYLGKGAGMSRESVLYLAERGVRVMGTDAWSFDRPMRAQAEDFTTTGNPGDVWEAHYAGRDCVYCHMEKLTNLGSIGRPHGFTVCCFPIKIKGASAGWVRPVAIVPG